MRALMFAVTLAFGFDYSACGASNSSTRERTAAYDIVGSHGRVRFVVVDERTLSSDAAIWRIADEIKARTGNGPLQVSFWTSRDDAPTSIPMSRRSSDTERAVININEGYGSCLLFRNKQRR
jgi:hypothetical protein